MHAHYCLQHTHNTDELNIGQLAREHFGMDATFSIGFTTHTGEFQVITLTIVKPFTDGWGQVQLLTLWHKQIEIWLQSPFYHTGTVAASDNWDEPMKVKNVRPSMPGELSARFQITLFA